jgi:hypothetical protein
MGPGRHIIASWIWEVLNPEIEYLDFEAELLPRSLTFREHMRDFERLKPLREGALMPDGRLVFDDMKGEQPDHDQAVESHDAALRSLREAAVHFFDALLAHQPFREAFAQIVADLQRRGVTQTPGSSDHERWLRVAAANVVNQLAGDLDSHFEDHRLWNEGHSQLKSAAPPQPLEELSQSRANFSAAIRSSREKLAQLRRSLSRANDVPVVQSGSLE